MSEKSVSSCHRLVLWIPVSMSSLEGGSVLALCIVLIDTNATHEYL